MTDVDLIVAGAGGGLVGALHAAQRGARVLVVEANRHYLRGNNTSMSTAMIPGAGSRWQRDVGIDDTPSRFLSDIAAKTGGDFAVSSATALAEISAELVEWLADHAEVPIELPTDFHYPGHSAQRVHSVPGRHGSMLLRHLVNAVSRRDRIDVLVPARVTAARHDDRGLLVTVLHPDGSHEDIATRTLLLATNGYGANRQLVETLLPEIASAHYHGSEHSIGDALRIGAAHSAATAYLDAYQGHAGLSAEARTLVTWTIVMHGGFVITDDGARFGNETQGYSEYAAVLAAQPRACGWMIYDDRIHQATLAFGDYADVVRSGAVHTGATPQALANVIGVAAHALEKEIDGAACVARGERFADRFGRTRFELSLVPPLYAVRIVPALFHTQGGLVVDENARVLNRSGDPIPGLYASGGAAAGISGHGAAGYLAGNGLLPALGLAYLAAGHITQPSTER